MPDAGRISDSKVSRTMLWVAIVSRWIHIITAIVLVGGSIFLRFVLGPAAAQLPDESHAKLKELVLGTWKKFVHGGIAFFLISGFYNYLAVQGPQHKGDKLYHALMGIKILLALAVFLIASGLVGRSKAFAAMRAKAKLWQGIMIALAILIIGISGFLKVRPNPVAASNATNAAVVTSVDN
jgi:uncharacterized membrane protein